MKHQRKNRWKESQQMPNFTVVTSAPKELAAKAPKSVILQAIRVYEDRKHPGNRTAKTRAEVNITKKKIYRQKGTGRARHGAASAPIFVGGGVTHGPKPVKRQLKMSQSQRKTATLGAMQEKITAKRVVSVAGLGGLTKTKEVNKVLVEIKKELKIKGKALFLIPNESKSGIAMRNIPETEFVILSRLNPYAIITASVVIVDASLIGAKAEKVKKTVTKTK